MRFGQSRGRLLIWLILLLVLAASIASDRDAHARAQGVKLLIDADQTDALSRVAAGDGIRLADYGAFSLWQVSAEVGPALQRQAGVILREDFDIIYLRDGFIDTRQDIAPATGRLRQTRRTGPQLWLVQFVGPTQPTWLNHLRKLGAEPVIYMPNHAYVVWADAAAIGRLEDAVRRRDFIQWAGPYHPAYRLAPALHALASSPADGWADVTVQFYTTDSVADSLAALQALCGQVYRAPFTLVGFTNISLQLPINRLAEIAAWPDVFNVEPYLMPQKLDEIQGQLVTGNVTISNSKLLPAGPGYLSWLATKGFPLTANRYPIVDVVDDGIDAGNALHPLHDDFRELGQPDRPSRIVYLQSCSATTDSAGPDGHGNLNAGILAGYNNRTGFPFQDVQGYRLGLGIAPYGRLAGTRIFRPDGRFDIRQCGNNDAGLVMASYRAGAQITSNSWGASVFGAYDTSAQAYDALTRDAAWEIEGNQAMLHVFAGGNDGSGLNSIGSPGTAKNVLTVGATESVRDQGIRDGCHMADADNAADIAGFSSRGPTRDGRSKPDLVAPGTHVQGPATQPPETFTGAGVCGAANNDGKLPGSDAWYPTGQSLYTWSSGTSHATPAIAGLAALAYEYYGRVFNPGAIPSPAMIKALLINATRYLSGVSVGDTLPSPHQGWGMPDLGMLTDGVPRILFDQGQIFDATGQTRQFMAQVADPQKPVRVTLAWTDAPGSTSGAAWVNDLDLEVFIGEELYRGNVFQGAWSVPNGRPDERNNVESVFLPAGISSTLMVRVKAVNLAGDGVPNNTSFTDQDFALVIYNAMPTSAPVLSSAGYALDDSAGNANGAAEPGERNIQLNIALRNDGNIPATAISTTLTAVTPGVRVTQAHSTYPNLPPGGLGANDIPFRFDVDAGVPCNTSLDFRLIIAAQQPMPPVRLSFPAGLPVSVVFTSTDVPKLIPDNNPNGVQSELLIAQELPATALRVTLTILHTYDADLDVFLEAPGGGRVMLFSDVGGSGHNFIETTLDDAAVTSITNGVAPFTGRFRPEEPLANLARTNVAGVWRLVLYDDSPLDIGTLQAWRLSADSVYCTIPVPHLSPVGLRTDDTAGNRNGVVEPGEPDIGLFVDLHNDGRADVTAIRATLAAATPGITVTQASATYADIAVGATTTNILPFRFDVADNVPCGVSLSFTLTVQAAEGTFVVPLTLSVGALLNQSFTSLNVPLQIPDYNPNGITSTITVASPHLIADLDVRLNITHSYAADLHAFLISPNDIKVVLFEKVGFDGDNFVDTILDDEAAIHIRDATAPFTGRFRPQDLLSAFDGSKAAGVWRLRVWDDSLADVGTLNAWGLDMTLWQCHAPLPSPSPSPTATPSSSPTVIPTPTVTPTPTITPTLVITPTPTAAPTVTPTPTITPTETPPPPFRFYLPLLWVEDFDRRSTAVDRTS